MNIINVVIQTIKSIATIKCGKWGAAIVNAIAYGLYTYIVVLTMCDIDLLTKCLIVAGANFVGVYVVKFFEEKARKDKLWKVEATVHQCYRDDLHYSLKNVDLPHNFIDNVGLYTVFNIYCATQEESIMAKNLLDRYKAKYFVSESKTL
jgi:uncharacterized protein YebE (UPF0316 family)